MTKLHPQLELDRCPHCSVATPNLVRNSVFETRNHAQAGKRLWSVYVCSSCGGVVTACSSQ